MHYERLSALDTSFLVQEGRFTYMHIASTAIFVPEPRIGGRGDGVDIERLRAYVASRLHLIPRYRQRLAHVPITNDPVWVDDERFDLGYHVRHVSLPRPGSDAQLRQLSARIIERQLDRARPLWECWFVEGLPSDRFAMITKVHHCMVDGIGGVDLLAALLAMAPSHHVEAAASWAPRPAPAGTELVREEAARRAKAVLGAVTNAATRTGQAGSVLGETARNVWSFAKSGARRAPRLSFNGTIGPHRRIEWATMSFESFRAIRRMLGGSVNDVVLATVAAALGRYLGRAGVDLAGTPVRAAVPVSIRRPEERGSGGNRVSAWLVDLPVAERDPWRRLSAVASSTEELRRSHQAEGAHALTEVAEWTGANLLGLAMKVLAGAQPHNLIVTNVPGPPMPLFLLDARMETIYPHLPLFERQGLGVALLSYAGQVSWGLTGDWDLMHNLDELRTAIEQAFEELHELAATIERERRREQPRLRLVRDGDDIRNPVSRAGESENLTIR